MMGGDPIPGHHEILRLWGRLRSLKGKEREEAVARLEEWLRMWESRPRPR